MFVVAIFRSLVTVIVYTVTITLLLAILPGIPPHNNFRPLNFAKPIRLEGKLAPKFVFDKVEILVSGKFAGAESLYLEGDAIYSGVETTEVIKVVDNGRDSADVTFLGKIGTPCSFGVESNSICSRPLGVRKDSDGKLVFADMHKGIVGFDVKTGKAEPYFEGADLLKNADDLDIAKDGTIYFSILNEGTTNDFLTDMLHPSGKLAKYDPKTKKVSVVIENVTMANGVQLSENEDFVLVNETPFCRIWRHYLKGPKGGTSDIFVDGLPGVPDNVRPNGRGGFYIALYSGRPLLLDWVGRYGLVQKILARVQWMLSRSLVFFKGIIGDGPILDHIQMMLHIYGPLGFDMFGESTVVEVDGMGNILAVLRHKDKKLMAITQISVGEKFAYLGSFVDDKIWKIGLQDLRNY